ncbi:MAG: NAD(P)-binding protein, partial [Thermaurantiacus sp.]
MGRPVRVAIIGGGCGAMAAAFELSRPEHQGRFEISVFQEGWRLGGKGASGRGPAGRVEEHGLHVWLGFYENSFRLMRECYGELASHPEGSPFGAWSEAFLPEPNIGLVSAREGGGLQLWSGKLPP